MELLILLLVPLLILCMIAVHAYAAQDAKPYSLTALVFMIIMGVLTSGLHFVILTVSRPIAAAGFASATLHFSFKWPSAAYTLDILAWDWFFALAMLFAVPVFREGGLERAVRYVRLVSGVLSLIGLLGVPLALLNVSYWLAVRNIGIVGYAVVSPIAFLLLALVFGRTEPRPS